MTKNVRGPRTDAGLTRRRLLGAGLGLSALALAGCSPGARPSSQEMARRVAAVEAGRASTGTVRAYTLTAGRAEVDLGGRTVSTYAYNGSTPGPLLRADVGDEVRVRLVNDLPAPTSVHWHGLALRNDMDGVAPMTDDVAQAGTFDYVFRAPHPGTYWYHPHVGIQLDYGLYAPLIIDDPDERSWYDEEWVVVLDDWTDDLGQDPRSILDELTAGGMDMDMAEGGSVAESGRSQATGLLGDDAGDVRYPAFLVNGRMVDDPEVLRTRPGSVIRIRVINAAADTAFRVALGGHSIRVTHTDGFAVTPVDGDAVLVGMGERYDLTVTAGEGVFDLVAKPEGKAGHARAVLRTAQGSTRPASALPRELDGRVLQVEDLRATDAAALPERDVDTEVTAVLDGDMSTYRWTINGKTFEETDPLAVTEGQRARLVFENRSSMWHPMHLHGHTFQVERSDGAGARKDTVVVKPRSRVPVVFDADNPGDWMIHCHNAYHAEAGMMTTLEYRI